jgi:HlyD family secretion protein
MDTLTMPPALIGAGSETAAASRGEDGANRSGRRPTALSVGLALLLFLAAVLAALAAAVLLRAKASTESQRYRTETVVQGQVTGVREVPARVIPRATVRVGSERVGRTTAVLVSPGDRVKRGQVLARLDNRELRAQAMGAQAAQLAAQVNARQAQMRLAQIVYLLQNGGGAIDETGEPLSGTELRAAALEAEVSLVNAAAELKKQEAAVTASRIVLAGSVLTAPMDGVVLSRAVEPGETVAAGAPLFVIAADPSEMHVVVPLTESDVARVRSGPVTFVVPALPGEVFQANIGAIEPAPTEDGTVGYQMRLRTTNPERHLRAGMTAKVSLPLDSTREALHVPVEALRFTPDGSNDHRSIYVLEHGKQPRRVPVELGVTDGRVVEVRAAALEPGASVILGKEGERPLD